ncbi:MAG: hypothetical protein QOF13_1172 [Solirubrobacterales bacterium]|jgi:hypothetical protein|nr:hypothetical protein [Solirubrobacterales bacterium]
MTTAARRPSRFDRLGIWIGLPLLALALLGLLFAALPETACDESADGSVGAWVIFLWGVGAAVGCLVAAAGLLVRLSRKPGGISRRQVVAAFVVVTILAGVGAVLSIPGEPSVYWHAWAVAAPATALALLVLVGAAALRRRVDDVGLLLPAYLIGAGLFVLPSLALIGALFKSDALCS